MSEKKDIAIKEGNQSAIQVALLEVVKNENIDPERLEKFLDLQVKMEDRQNERDLKTALMEFQSKCPNVERKKEGHNGKYAPLEDIVEVIKPILKETGLSFTFSVEPVSEKTSRLYTTIHHINGGSFVSNYDFPSTDMSGKKNEAQGTRSASSYAKRTGLENALGIITVGEDKDGGKQVTEKEHKKMLAEIEKLLIDTKADEAGFLKYVGAKNIEELTAKQCELGLRALKQKKRGA